MLEHKSALLGVNHVASRFNKDQPVYVVPGFVQTPDRSDPEEVSIRKSLENIEHGIHFAPPPFERCRVHAFWRPYPQNQSCSCLLLLNQYVEGWAESSEGVTLRVFFSVRRKQVPLFMDNERVSEIFKARGGGRSVKPIEILPCGRDAKLVSGDNRRAQNFGRSTTSASAEEVFSSPLS
jgi:hypothetical protein